MTMPPSWPAISLAEAHRRLTAPGAPFEMEEVTVRGVVLRAWKAAPPTLRDLFLSARQYGSRDFLVYEGDRASYDAFMRATLRLASELAARGVGKGDRVALVMRNWPEWPVCFFAGVVLGAVGQFPAASKKRTRSRQNINIC